MKKIAIIDKCPSKTNYSKYFTFEFDHYHLSSVYLTKVLKKDVDIEIDIDSYDFVVLVGSEATKMYTGKTVTSNLGLLIDNKFMPITNPAMLAFKPEGKNDFDRAVAQIEKYIKGELTNSSVSGDFKGIDTEQDAMVFLLEVLAQPTCTVAIDTETTSLYPRNGHVLGISMSYKIKHGRYILSDVLTDDHIAVLQLIINKHNIVFHNRKFDQKMLEYHFNLKFPEYCDDTMLEHYTLDEAQGTHGLKDLAIKFTLYGDYDAALEDFRKEYCSSHGVLTSEFTYDLIPYDIISVYASIDTAVTLELHMKFKPIIEANPKLKKLYDTILIPGIVCLMKMEETGIPMGIDRLIAAERYLDDKIQTAKLAIYQFPEVQLFEKNEEKIFNPNSVMQLRKLLFDYLDLSPTGKLTKAGALSTDAEVLEELSSEHPLPAAILKIRQLSKIKNTYVSKIIPELDKDGKIRTNFNLSFTTSGRLSSSGKLNAQQFPRDDPIVKGCILAPTGYKIISQDLRTAEVYYAAVLSGDKELQKIFSLSGDFHSNIAKKVFKLNCAVEDVKKLFPLDRQAAKAVTFGILYGSGPAKVAETVNKEGGNLTLQDAKDIIEEYFDTFKQLRKWLNERKTFIEQNGFTYSFFGRKRRLQNVFSSDKGIASHEVRSGINAEIQSIASDVNLLAAIEITKEFERLNLDAKIFMLVHDSIVVLAKDECVEEACAIMKKITQAERGCSIQGFPIGVDQDIGQDYSFGHFEEVYEFKDNIISDLPPRKE